MTAGMSRELMYAIGFGLTSGDDEIATTISTFVIEVEAQAFIDVNCELYWTEGREEYK